MKVVLFCGGLGMRIREAGENVPKPMVTIGYRPILWHVMKYYAHHGHKDFVLCLGYRGDVIKDYFLNYSGDVVERLRADGGRQEARADGERHPRLEDYLRRDWPAVEHRAASQGRRARGRRRTGISRQLQRRPVESLAAGTSGAFPDPRRRGQLRQREAQSELSPGRQPRVAGSPRFRISARRRSASMAGSSCFKREIFDYMQATAKSSWSNRSSVWSACASWRRTSSTASGSRWTRSRIDSSSKKFTHAATPRGPCGTSSGWRPQIPRPPFMPDSHPGPHAS